MKDNCFFCGKDPRDDIFVSALKKGEVVVVPMSKEIENFYKAIEELKEQGWEETSICIECQAK